MDGCNKPASCDKQTESFKRLRWTEPMLLLNQEQRGRNVQSKVTDSDVGGELTGLNGATEE